jgi:ribonuclease BN (tRNA processing enzyme)
VKLRILGSGTLLPDAVHGSPAHWIEEEGHRILVDCGAGTLRTLARLGLPWKRITHLLLTHFHTDHVGDLAPLLFALKHGASRERTMPLTVLGPRGLVRHLNGLAEAHGAFILEPGVPLRIRELEPGARLQEGEMRWSLSTASTRHTETSLALRIETGNGVVGFTGDTGPDPALGSFFRGCHVLVAECSRPDGEEMDTHLSPSGLARLARDAAPHLLITVHVYPPLDPDQVPGLLAAAGYAGRALPGRDGLGVDLSAGVVEVRGSDPSTGE